MFSLADGRYEVFVVAASEEANGLGVHLELAITSGSCKGDLVRVRATLENVSGTNTISGIVQSNTAGGPERGSPSSTSSSCAVSCTPSPATPPASRAARWAVNH